MEEKAIVEKKQTLPSIHSPSMGEQDEDGLTQREIKITFIKIVQPSPKLGNKNAGVFLFPSGQSVQKLEKIVFLVRKSGRILYPPKDFSGARLCWSSNQKEPDLQFMTRQGLTPKCHSCIECPFAKWDNKNGKGIPPECKEKYTFLAVNLNTKEPFLISFKGLAISSMKQFCSLIQMEKNRLRFATNQQFLMKDFVFSLSLEKKQTSNGEFYIPVWKDIKQLEEKDKTIIDKFWASVVPSQIQVEPEEDEIEKETQNDDEPPF